MTVPREGEYMDYLIRYLDKNFSKGYTDTELRVILERQGYSRSAVDRAFKLFSQKKQKEQSKVKKEEPKKEVEVVEEPPKKKKGFLSWLFGLGGIEEEKAE